ncbi:hypothetical protein Tco_0861828 [Tanacetum coccineum]
MFFILNLKIISQSITKIGDGYGSDDFVAGSDSSRERKKELAQLTCACGRHIGTQSGGMDQTNRKIQVVCIAKEDSNAWEQAKVVVISMKIRDHKGHDGGVWPQTQDGSVKAFSSTQKGENNYLTEMKDRGREIRKIVNGKGEICGSE